MSDDEREYSEEEEEIETRKRSDSQRRKTVSEEAPKMTEAEMAMEEKMKKKKEEEEQMWQEYMEQRRAQRAKEEEELKKLKERQLKRKAQRAEQEKRMMEYKRKQEEQRIKEMEDKKTREVEAKRKRLEEAERKRQAMQEAMEKKKIEPIKPNFVITKRDDGGPGASIGTSATDKFANVMAARSEMGKTKEQLEDDKKIALTFRVKPLEMEGLGEEELKKKAAELWEKIVNLESEKYDLEERQKRQDYDLKELAERQRQINRNKAMKKGLDPDAAEGKHPPKVNVASKYERRVDRRTYKDKQDLFSGGLEAMTEAGLEKEWEDKMSTYKDKGESKLPKWNPEHPENKKEPAHRRGILEDDDEEDLLPPIPAFQDEPAPPKAAPAPEPEAEEEEEAEESEYEEDEEEEEEEE